MKKLFFCLFLVGTLFGANLDKAQIYSYEEAPGPHYAPVLTYDQGTDFTAGHVSLG